MNHVHVVVDINIKSVALMDNDRKIVANAFYKRTGIKYENWIQAMAVQHKLNRRTDWFRVFLWLGCIPAFTFFSWYGIYKLVMWMLYG